MNARGVAEGQATADEPVIVLRAADDELAHVLLEAQKLLLVHPIAAQSAFAALIAEGRAFAETPEGADWKVRLENSELVARVATLWENVTFNVLEEEGTLLPTRLLDVIVMAAGIAPLDGFLARLLRKDDSGQDAT